MTYDASNIAPSSNNPAYTGEDFLADMPQFAAMADNPWLDRLVTMAHAAVSADRWCEMWRLGMSLHIAHHATLLLRSFNAAATTADEAVASGEDEGLLTHQKTGEVAVQFDHKTLTAGTEAWGSWNATTYGQQFVTYARMFAIGGSYVI